MATIPQTTLTAEEFEHVDLPFCELKHGTLVLLTAAEWSQALLTTRIAYLLTQWAERTSIGRVLSGDAGIITQRGPDTVRGIDVAYFSFQRVPAGQEPSGFATTPPELAVEIVGKGQGWPKMLEKASEYLELGVDRVWIVNPRNQTIHVYRKDQEDSQRFTIGDTLTDEAMLPGFSVAVADIFKNA